MSLYLHAPQGGCIAYRYYPIALQRSAWRSECFESLALSISDLGRNANGLPFRELKLF